MNSLDNNIERERERGQQFGGGVRASVSVLAVSAWSVSNCDISPLQVTIYQNYYIFQQQYYPTQPQVVIVVDCRKTAVLSPPTAVLAVVEREVITRFRRNYL